MILKINLAHSEALTVPDTRASLVKVLTHTIVKMVLVAADAVTRRTDTEKVTGAKKPQVLFLLKKAKKVKPSLKENPANLVSLVSPVSLVNLKLKNLNLSLLLRKRSDSLWICTWLRSKPRAKAFTRNLKLALLRSSNRKTFRLLQALRLSNKEVQLHLSKPTKSTLSEPASVPSFWASISPKMRMTSSHVAVEVAVAEAATDLATTDQTPLNSRKAAVKAAS